MAMGTTPALLLGAALALGGFAIPNSRAAIVFPTAPDGGKQLVRDGLKNYPASTSRYLQNHELRDLTIGKPIRNYLVTPKVITDGHLLTDAQPANWIYPLMHGTNAVAAAELTEAGSAGSKLEFAELITTDIPNQTGVLQRMAGQLPQVQKEDYQVRRLECPAILFTALWLHGKSDDIIIPLPPSRDGWHARQTYSEGEMAKILEPVAEKHLEAPDGPLPLP